jgi:hypothetical protein
LQKKSNQDELCNNIGVSWMIKKWFPETCIGDELNWRLLWTTTDHIVKSLIIIQSVIPRDNFRHYSIEPLRNKDDPMKLESGRKLSLNKFRSTCCLSLAENTLIHVYCMITILRLQCIANMDSGTNNFISERNL